MKFIKYIPDFKIGGSKIYLRKRTSKNKFPYNSGVNILRTLEFRFLSFYRELMLIEENVIIKKQR